MNRIVKPVRAWAEYDEWTWFWDAGSEKMYAIPSTAEGQPFVSGWPSVVQAALSFEHKSLRSLRVLYENGYELHVATYENVDAYYDWWVTSGETVVARGDFEEDRDSEAVERAMIAAAAWFTQHDPSLVK